MEQQGIFKDGKTSGQPQTSPKQYSIQENNGAMFIKLGEN